MSDPTRGGLPPLTGDPSKDFAGGALPPLTGDLSKDFSATGDQKLHAEYKSGALAKRMAAANAAEAPSTLEKAESAVEPVLAHAANVASGFGPFALAQRGYSELGGLLAGESPEEGTQAVEQATSAIGGVPGFLERAAGMAAGAEMLPMGTATNAASKAAKIWNAAKYGAVLGGLHGVTQGMAQGDTPTMANVSGLVNAAGGLIGGGAGEWAGQKLAASPMIANLAAKFGAPGSDLANLPETAGPQGAANDVLAGRQSIYDALQGSGKSASQQQMERIAATKAQARAMYGQVQESPAIQAVAEKWMQDPSISDAINAAAARLNRPAVGSDPEVLQMAKQMVQQDVNRGLTGASSAGKTEAYNTLNALDQFRADLRAASPELAAADDAFSLAKQGETAFQRGTALATRSVGKTLGSTTKGKTPEELMAWVQSSPTPDIQAARQSALQSGAAAKLADALRNTTMGDAAGANLSGVLTPANEAQAAVRRMAFGSDQEARDFSGLLGELAARAQETHGTGLHAYMGLPVPGVHVYDRLSTLFPKGPLSTPEGGRLMGQYAADLSTPAGRQAIQAQLARYASGLNAQNVLQQLAAKAGMIAPLAGLQSFEGNRP